MFPTRSIGRHQKAQHSLFPLEPFLTFHFFSFPEFLVLTSLFWLFSLPFRIIWWIVRLPFLLVGFAWHHKVLATFVIVAVVGSAYLHNPANTIDFHSGYLGVVWYVLIGFANFFYGIWDSLCHFGGDVISIPQKMSGCPFSQHPFGWVVGSLVHLVFWAIPESLMYWGLNHLLTKEACWGIFFAFGAFALSGGKGGHAAPKPSGGGGGHH